MGGRGERIAMSRSSTPLYIDSEIGKLKSVIVHSPGQEIEVMTPKTAELVLYNDIVPYEAVAEEHRILKDLLSCICTTYEFTALLRKVLEKDELRKKCIREIVRVFSIEHREKDLAAMEPEKLLRVLIYGLPEKKETLTSFLSDREFDINPLPNLYFTRDSGMVFRDTAVIGSMAHDVRRLEALLARYILQYHPDFTCQNFLYDGSQEKSPGITLEGGDFLVLNSHVLLLGISERTTSRAVDCIAGRLAARFREEITIFCVILPRERATIHLDMIFTLLDKNQALVYEPYILSTAPLRVIRMDVSPKGRTLKQERDLLTGLSGAGIDIEPVLCGGGDKKRQQREQWLSGTNFLSIAPGKIIGYECNTSTFEALDKAGYAVRKAKDFISGSEDLDAFEKCAVSVPGIELARGGGGVRCMTMPVKREAQ